jgi:hypothetical protein
VALVTKLDIAGFGSIVNTNVVTSYIARCQATAAIHKYGVVIKVMVCTAPVWFSGLIVCGPTATGLATIGIGDVGHNDVVGSGSVKL